MKALKLALVLLVLSFGPELFLGAPAIAADRTAAPPYSAEQVALILDRLNAPAASAIVRTAGSCTTSCGPGPEGNCSKSCKDGESCTATCSGGKAVCRCE